MAKMIPAHIERDDPRRTGEYMVYDWLSDDSIPGVVFYSHSQNNHEHKTMSEIDFLYICNNGLLCIEVKGGQIHKDDAQWFSTNKRGETYKINDPFWQSHGCMKAVESTIESTYGKKSIESKFCVGCAVVFPECIAKCKGDSVIKEVMFDGRNSLSEFPDYLKSCIKHWSDELYGKQSKRTIPISEDQINQLVTLFAADFGAIPSMKLQIESSYAEMKRLTDEQYDVIHSIDDNKRVIVFGVAGTGKSLLAVHKLKQNIIKKKRAAYICFNKNMASYVNENVKVPSDSFIGTYHALLGKYIDDAHDMELEELNNEYQRLKPQIKEQYDVIIVDEAQDILAKKTVECLNGFLAGGMQNGEWIFFADPNQDIFLKGKAFGEAEAYLKENYNPCVFRLIRNCRNTAQIARRNSMLTNTPATKYLNLSGPEVKVVEYSENGEFIEKLDKELRSLLSGGTAVSEIVILSPKRLDNSLLNGVTRLADVDLVEVRSFKGIKKNQINYLTVQSYKGLESKVVFYIDIDGFESIENRRINYVAMSRAQIYLCYFVDSRLKAEYEQRMLDGMEMLS